MGGRMASPGNMHNLRHGHASNGMRTPEYKAWENMIDRCTNPKNSSYRRYGGRGIKVWPAWRASFEAFFAAVGPRPSSDHSLDRFPDNDGNYVPGNVRWATKSEQQKNTSRARLITAFGQTLNLVDWARIKGIPLDTLWRRLTVWGWDPEIALSTPVRNKTRVAELVKAAGYASVSDFLRQHAISPTTLYKLAIPGKNITGATRARFDALLGAERVAAMLEGRPIE